MRTFLALTLMDARSWAQQTIIAPMAASRWASPPLGLPSLADQQMPVAATSRGEWPGFEAASPDR
jgi:hypothetical protein